MWKTIKLFLDFISSIALMILVFLMVFAYAASIVGLMSIINMDGAIMTVMLGICLVVWLRKEKLHQ